MRSSVDLPQPLGPTMHRNSPGETERLMSSIATTRAWLVTNSLCSATISTAAPRRSATIKTPSAATVQAAVPVLDDERPELLDRVVDVGVVDKPLGRELPAGQSGLGEPGLHVEQAFLAHAAVGVARRPRIFLQHVGPALGAGADQEIDQLLADGAAVIGLTIVAHAAHVGEHVVADQLAVLLLPI